MKSYYVSFIYLRPSTEVKLGFSTISKYFKFAATLYYSCVLKEGVFWENYCRYMNSEELREEILFGLRGMTAVTGKVSDLQSIPIVFFPS